MTGLLLLATKPAVCKDGPLCLGWTPELRFLLDADPSILQSSPDGESVIEAVLMLVRRNCAPLLVSDSKDLQDHNLDHTAFECLNDILGSTSEVKSPNVYESPRYGLANERVLCSFGAAGSEHAKLVYDDATILVAMAIMDNVLVGIRSEADLQELEIPQGENDPSPLCHRRGKKGHTTETL